MLMLILFLTAPLLIAPLVVYGGRHLFAVFVRQAADLFLDRDIHKEWAVMLGTDMAIVNVFIFCLAWWASVAFGSMHLPSLVIVAPFVAGLALAFLVTIVTLKGRLKLAPSQACAVGLLTCAGGNLPMMILTPFLVTLANSQQIIWMAEELVAP